jgi:hypothetical protein
VVNYQRVSRVQRNGIMRQHNIGDLVKFKYYGYDETGDDLIPILDIVGIVVRCFWDNHAQSWYCTCYFGEHGTCDCEQSTLKNLTNPANRLDFIGTQAVEVKHGD